jgi:hypothetical protein
MYKMLSVLSLFGVAFCSFCAYKYSVGGQSKEFNIMVLLAFIWAILFGTSVIKK